jgi:hypothetical protein
MANYLLAGDDQFGFQVVGESHYQSELAKIAGGITDEGVHQECAALLRLEPTNKYDPHAVEVLIAGMRVGYIPASQAPEICALFNSVGIFQAGCEAVIQGGWDRGGGDAGAFGVRLNIVRPFAFVDDSAEVRTAIPLREQQFSPPMRIAAGRDNERWRLTLGAAVMAAAAIFVVWAVKRIPHEDPPPLRLTANPERTPAPTSPTKETLSTAAEEPSMMLGTARAYLATRPR